MKFKFIHTSDWHFGATRKLTPGSEQYLDRQKAVYDQIIEIAKDPEIKFILVSGDVFEDKGTTIPEFIFAINIFKELGKLKPVICTAGNHDELKNGTFQTLWLEMINIPNVQFISKPERVYLDVDGHRIGILAMPWTGLKDQDEFDLLVMNNLAPDIQIVMLHECFNGSMLDNGKRYPGGILVPDIPGIKYFALGDIHKMQQMNIPHAWFSGAPLQYTFGDKPEKGLLIVSGDTEQESTYVPEFKKLQCPVLLKKITDEKQIDPESPHWYSLYCQADKVPLIRPENLKKINPQPVKVEMPEAFQGEEPLAANQIKVDYAEGVDQILQELQYTPEEIKTEQEHIRHIAAQQGV